MKAILHGAGKILFEALRVLGLGIYRLAGWRIEGDLPDAKKFVAVAAPHTSNWDLPLLLCVALHFRTRVRWIGKAALFKPPFGWLMSVLGGMPVDRSKTNNVVTQMVEAFAEREKFALALAPEGTRAKAPCWKSGFYNIAQGAGVPIVLGFLDYARKTGGVGMVLHASGDYDADLEIIQAFYAQVTPKFPDRGVEAG